MALTPQQLSQFRGHPTAPGIRDFPGVSRTSPLPTTSATLSALPMGSDKYTRDGKPGIPRYIAPYPREMHSDPASLGDHGPKNINVKSWDEVPHAGFEPWNSRNEKLRQQAIQAAQSGQA